MSIVSVKRLVVLLAMAAVAASCGPAPNSFYEDPASFPGSPGDVARSFATLFNMNESIDQYTVLYQSTNVAQQPMLVSGAVIVPQEPWVGGGPRPIVAMASGTQGAGDDCAPSKLVAQSGMYEIVVVEALLNAGYSVALTDYEGLGTPGPTTYTIAAPSANALLDVARAAIRLPEAGLDANAPVILYGYSQGGQASAKAAEIESVYAPELNIKGAVAGGVPADLAGVGDFLNSPQGNFWFFFLALTADGLSNAYPELDIDPFLTPEGRQQLQDGLQQCLLGSILAGTGGSIEDLTVTNPLTDPAWQARIDEQKLGNVPPTVPVRLIHATGDQVIPFDQGTGLRDRWCAAGGKVDWQQYEGSEHIGTIFFSIPENLQWIQARLADGPVGSYC